MSLVILIGESNSLVSGSFPGAVLYEVQCGSCFNPVSVDDVGSWRFSYFHDGATVYSVFNDSGWVSPEEEGRLAYRHIHARSYDSEQYVIDAIGSYDGDLGSGIIDIPDLVSNIRAAGWYQNITHIALVAPVVSTIPVPFYAINFNGERGAPLVVMAQSGMVRDKLVSPQGIQSSEVLGEVAVS